MVKFVCDLHGSVCIDTRPSPWPSPRKRGEGICWVGTVTPEEIHEHPTHSHPRQ